MSWDFNRKYTFADILKHYRSEGYEPLISANEYKNCNQKIPIRCPQNHTWLSTYHKFKQNYRCKLCYDKYHRWTHEKAKNYFAVYGYTLLSEYKEYHKPALVQCPKGNKWKVSLSHFQKGYRIPKRKKYHISE